MTLIAHLSERFPLVSPRAPRRFLPGPLDRPERPCPLCPRVVPVTVTDGRTTVTRYRIEEPT